MKKTPSYQVGFKAEIFANSILIIRTQIPIARLKYKYKGIKIQEMLFQVRFA